MPGGKREAALAASVQPRVPIVRSACCQPGWPKAKRRCVSSRMVIGVESRVRLRSRSGAAAASRMPNTPAKDSPQ